MIVYSRGSKKFEDISFSWYVAPRKKCLFEGEQNCLIKDMLDQEFKESSAPRYLLIQRQVRPRIEVLKTKSDFRIPKPSFRNAKRFQCQNQASACYSKIEVTSPSNIKLKSTFKSSRCESSKATKISKMLPKYSKLQEKIKSSSKIYVCWEDSKSRLIQDVEDNEKASKSTQHWRFSTKGLIMFI